MSNDRPVFVSYSANREDVILNRVFGSRHSGFYIDVGAGHPVYENDTKALYDRGWRGINVEPSPALFGALAEHRPLDRNINVAVCDVPGRIILHQVAGLGLSTCDADEAKRAAARGFEVVPHVIEAMTLCGIIEAMPAPPIDLLRVDVEGLELQVLSSNDWMRFRPKVILVSAGFPEMPVRREDGVAAYLAARGYRQVYFDGVNNYYVEQDFETTPEMFDRPPNVFDHFEPYPRHKMAGQVRSLAEERDHALGLLTSARAQARLGMRQAEALSIDVENARAELLSMRERGTALAAQLEAMGREHERLIAMHERLKAMHERLKAIEQEHAARIVSLASQLDRIYSSASWRITRPLRGLAQPARSLRIILRRFRR